jgi:GT2 family glycosyltransferase
LLTTVRSVLSVRRFGRGTNAGLFAAVEAGAPVIAGAGVALANDLPDAMRVDEDPQALADAIVACVHDEAAWRARARATTEWSATIGAGRYRDALDAVLGANGLTLGAAAPVAAGVTVPWAVREHGRWSPDPAAPVASSVPRIDLALADQVTTTGVPDPEALLTFPLASPYHEWIRQRDPSPRQRWANDARMASMPWQPTISIVVPVHDCEPHLLAATIASLRSQVYSRWEACIADDGSTDLDTLAALTAAAGDDARVRLLHARSDAEDDSDGASASNAASVVNTAVGRARGAFVGFVPPGGHLEPLALLEIVDLLNRVPELDVVYTDEHEYDPATGRRTNPSLKPSWSPDLLRSGNYLGQLTVFRRELVLELGGVRADFAAARDYDLALRATAASDRVGHVAWPLYRSDVPRPNAEGAAAARASAEAGRRALVDAVERAGETAVVEDLDHRGRYRVRYGIVDEPRVGIAIPTRDRHDLLAAAITSIRERSTYRNIEITIIDNESRDPEALAYFDRHDGPVLRYDAPFNYARMMNLAIAASDADLLLLLNNDVEVHQPDWIESMVEHAQRSRVGAVGARLWLPSGAPQHQGIFVGGIGGAVNADFVDAYFPGDDRHFIAGLGSAVANFAAVTGACLMARPAVLAEVGGFDERLHVAFNDVDLCLKLRARGYDIVCTPFASVVHEESATRGSDHPMANDDLFRARWRADDDYEDPYSNPNYDQRRRFALNPTWHEVEGRRAVREGR